VNSRLRILLVDDEALARARARRMLEDIEGVELAGEAGSADEARRFLAKNDVDVMLLDIQMPGEDGFSLLASIQKRPAVIFSTAFDQYAVRAFEENAVDYLLKPYRRERLEEALARARRELTSPEDLSRRLSELLTSLKGDSSPHLERFTVRVGQRQLILKAEEVLWFGAEDKLVFAATEKDRHYVNFTLDQLESRLDEKRFARVHRSAIVNLDWAAALRPGFAGTWRLQLRDAARTEVPVSRARARTLRERLGA
jgi:two-component system LytT family response regulator